MLPRMVRHTWQLQMQSEELPENRKGTKMKRILEFLLRNCYSILFGTFAVLNWLLLNHFFPHAINSNFVCLVWLVIHVVALFWKVYPAEIELQKRLGLYRGEDKEE